MASGTTPGRKILENLPVRISYQTRKSKKMAEGKEERVGDLVLEIDPNTDSGNWSLAVIKEVLPSNDGLVRKVIITTNGKDYTRPITRLAPLEYNINKNEIL
jgi:hypothetical protein